MDLSPEQKKKMKKAKLSKTLASQKLSKEAILNRMSSGKKRPKSEARIRKERMKTPSKDDLVAKKLFFPEGSEDDDDDEEELDMDLHQSPVKSKSRVGSESVLKKSSSTKKLQSSTSKWQVSEGKPSAKKQKVVKDQEKADSKMTDKKNKNKKLTNEEVDDEEDAEIDFPILKRKSLGMGEFKEVFSSKKSSQKEQKVTKEISENEQSQKKLKKKKVEEITENGQSEKKQKKKKEKEILSEEEMSKDSMSKNAEDDKGKKKKNKKRGKKRKRSNSESEEPQAKKEKPAREGFAVRCGNLPAGVRKGSLRMFIGEADIFPSCIMLKKKKKSGAGEKKQFVTYATIICSTANEAEKLCNLNGISMPSPVGSKERKLLIHKLNDSSNQDPTLKRKLFVSNLHPKIKEDELMAFFESGNFNPTNVILPKKGNDKTSRGYAFVWVSSAGDADRALKLKNPTLRDQTFSIARSHRHPTNQEP